MRAPLPTPDSGPKPDVFASMRADHRAVLDRVASIEPHADRIGAGSGSADDEAHVRGLADHLEAQFATHMRAEDEILYPALALALPDARGSLEPLRGEHHELRDMLASLRATLDEAPSAVRNEQIAVQTKDLADLLRIHIRKEEAFVFTVAERLMGPRELTALGARLARLASSASPHSPPAPGDSKEG